MKNKTIRALSFLSALLLLCMPFAMADTPDRGDLVKFIPFKITVKSNQVIVEGYFVNMNEDYTVKDFREFEMSVYDEGELLVSGDFGTINSFSIAPLRIKYQSFTFNGSHGLKIGTYVADDGYYCKVTMRFTTVKN